MKTLENAHKVLEEMKNLVKENNEMLDWNNHKGYKFHSCFQEVRRDTAQLENWIDMLERSLIRAQEKFNKNN